MPSSAPQPRAVKLSDWIIASNQSANLLTLRHRRLESWPAWYLQLLTELSVIDKADPIIFLSSAVTNDDPPGGTVFALTKALAVNAVATVHGSVADGEVELTVWSRGALEEVRILHAADYSIFEADESEALPQFLQLELRYSGRPALRLPLAERPGHRAEQEVAALYPKLLRDITTQIEFK